jgi:phospholipid transport system substrate-binding protein
MESMRTSDNVVTRTRSATAIPSKVRVIPFLRMAAMRTLPTWLFVMAVLLQSLRAYAAETPSEIFVQQNVEKGFAILKDNSLAPQEREVRFRALLRSIIDVKRVAIFALGPYARGASDEQIDHFVNAFSDYFMNMFHFDLHQNFVGQTIAVTGSTVRAADDVIVTTSVVGADTSSAAGMPMNLAFRVRKNAAGNDTIVDVLVGGISMALTERNEFSSYLQQHSGNIEELSAELEKRAVAR